MKSFAALALLLLDSPAGSGEQEIRPDSFEHLQALIRPTAEESGWSSIAWFGDMTEARKKAAAEGKPLYVWTMSGEPLGMC